MTVVGGSEHRRAGIMDRVSSFKPHVVPYRDTCTGGGHR